ISHVKGQPTIVDTTFAVKTPTNLRLALTDATRRATQVSMPTIGMSKKNAAGNTSMSIGTPASARIGVMA
ncbi:MAG TPA: hypothetical protein VIZ18_02840, partial [Ktedonobacteraceae bacterium]